MCLEMKGIIGREGWVLRGVDFDCSLTYILNERIGWRIADLHLIWDKVEFTRNFLGLLRLEARYRRCGRLRAVEKSVIEAWNPVLLLIFINPIAPRSPPKSKRKITKSIQFLRIAEFVKFNSLLRASRVFN